MTARRRDPPVEQVRTDALLALREWYWSRGTKGEPAASRKLARVTEAMVRVERGRANGTGKPVVVGECCNGTEGCEGRGEKHWCET